MMRELVKTLRDELPKVFRQEALTTKKFRSRKVQQSRTGAQRAVCRSGPVVGLKDFVALAHNGAAEMKE